MYTDFDLIWQNVTDWCKTVPNSLLYDFFNEDNSKRLSTEEHIESEIKLQHTKIVKIKGQMRSKNYNFTKKYLNKSSMISKSYLRLTNNLKYKN